MEYTPAQHQAFRQLQSVVQELFSLGKRRVGAYLKPELARRSGGAFDETKLGFLKFSEFLRAAEEAHYIRLAPYGLDVEAWPRDANPVQHQRHGGLMRDRFEKATDTRGAKVGIRPDLWDAFVDFTPGYVRVYDVKADKAYRFPQLEYPGEAPEVSQLRARLANRDQSLLYIQPIAPAQLVDWMRSFVAQQSGDVAESLRAALGGEHPLPTFMRLVRAYPAVFSQWHRYRLEKVYEYIQAWMSQNGIETEIKVPYLGRARVQTKPKGPGLQGESVMDIRLIEVIDGVIAELLRLRGALDYLRQSRE